MYKIKIDRTEGINRRNKYFYNNNLRLQYPTINNGQKNQTKISKKKDNLNTINQLDLTEIFQTLSTTHSSQFHTEHSQDRPYNRTQIKSQ